MSKVTTSTCDVCTIILFYKKGLSLLAIVTNFNELLRTITARGKCTYLRYILKVNKEKNTCAYIQLWTSKLHLHQLLKKITHHYNLGYKSYDCVVFFNISKSIPITTLAGSSKSCKNSSKHMQKARI